MAPEDIFHIKKILDNKLKKFSLPDESLKKEVIKTIKDVCGIEVKKEEINFIRGIVYLKVPQNIKTEIFIKRVYILKNLADSLGGKSPKDIR